MRYSTIDVQLHSTKTTKRRGGVWIHHIYTESSQSRVTHCKWSIESRVSHLKYDLPSPPYSSSPHVAPQRWCTACLTGENTVWESESELTSSAGRLCRIVCRIKNHSNALLHHEGDDALCIGWRRLFNACLNLQSKASHLGWHHTTHLSISVHRMLCDIYSYLRVGIPPPSLWRGRYVLWLSSISIHGIGTASLTVELFTRLRCYVLQVHNPGNRIYNWLKRLSIDL